MPLRTFAALGVALAVAASAGAASSRLGVVVVPVGPAGARSEALALALQSDGKIVAAGDTGSTSFAFALVRLKRNGALDPSFGTGGKVTTTVGDISAVTSLAVQPDGKILAAGANASRTAGTTPLLARYLPNGSLDPSFGSAGIVTGAGGTLALQPDERIVTSHSTKVVRLLPNGAPDPSFGSGGSAALPYGSATAVAVQADGNIVVVGAQCEQFCGFALARFTASGLLDESFGNGGVAAPMQGIPLSLTVAPNGAIVLVGLSGGELGTTNIWRFRPNGSIDPSLQGSTLVGAVAVDHSGRVVVAGSGDRAVALVRYRADGSLDRSFGRNGLVETRIGSSSHAAAVVIQPDGKIVVAGSANVAGQASSFVIARYTAKGTLDRTFGPGCTVPKLLGLKLHRAKARIVAAGCRAGAVVSRKSARGPGRVIGQTPKPGTRLELGSPVRLVVSR